jgi:hypothetical protein
MGLTLKTTFNSNGFGPDQMPDGPVYWQPCSISAVRNTTIAILIDMLFIIDSKTTTNIKKMKTEASTTIPFLS